MPAKPVRDSSGVVVPHDDSNIADCGYLIRHINPEYHTCLDENFGCRRIASSAFSASKGDPDFGMSSDIGQLLDEAGRPQDAMVPSGFGAVRVQVGPMRQIPLKVGSDPEPANEFHGQAWGVKDRIRNKVHRLVIDWLVPLDGVRIR
jgi:hypothetical protein